MSTFGFLHLAFAPPSVEGRSAVRRRQIRNSPGFIATSHLIIKFETDARKEKGKKCETKISLTAKDLETQIRVIEIVVKSPYQYQTNYRDKYVEIKKVK